jgi:hypothetical protein
VHLQPLADGARSRPDLLRDGHSRHPSLPKHLDPRLRVLEVPVSAEVPLPCALRATPFTSRASARSSVFAGHCLHRVS